MLDEYQDLRTEILLLRTTAPLNLFMLDCVEVNHDFSVKALKLRDVLVRYQVDDNRELNKASVLHSLLTLFLIIIIIIIKPTSHSATTSLGQF